jgi:acyl-CoA dehydrogenase
VASFDIEPSFAAKLDWVRGFVADEIEPLDVLLGSEDVIYDKTHPIHADVIRPLQDRVRDEGLWSCHLTPELGGQSYGQVHLAYRRAAAVGGAQIVGA